MKINQELRTQLDKTPKNFTSPKQTVSSFNSVITAKNQEIKGNELQRFIEAITLQGERISRYRSFQDLTKYKRMVKSFIKESVSTGLGLKQSHSNNRSLLLVAEIDQKLLELTEMVLDQEKKNIDVLDMIGEIKGLLVNLYM
ncbi:YaaR family protein [Aquibacillus salsiterrae]|uniref:YaaR family protein n=1 Tax=Aquibacillus salsiterrae TaxID=2950439 RepID=A0A9X4AH98_9BACI|nr:YaaR family protein [Aquibacillus salsiterrae]MDC3417953.1 YaaR family protein [Aquibacillus salsiterrae]